MKKVFFIGIGGIGMSALARYYRSRGYIVSGSDAAEGEVVKGLREEGVLVFIGADANNIPKDVERVIYTIAIPPTQVEFVKAKELAVSGKSILQTYPEALGEMTNNKKVIAVCGTHGKTTTTAMTYYALQNAGVDVSMIVGSLIEVDGKKTNYVHGESEWIVIEACEYRRSFLNYNPNIVLVTNIDNDHMDYFKDADDTKSAFQEFVDKTSFEGGNILKENALIVHRAEVFLRVPENVSKIICEEFSAEDEIELQVPGIHNRKNAQLVVALGEFLKLDKQNILNGLKNFKGTWRRQEFKGEFLGASFYDDYAHHPTEIRATLQAFREKFPNRKIIAVFQPHLFSRTKLLFTDFINSFSDADEVVVLPIYASREKFDESINSEMVQKELEKIDKVSVVVSLENLVNYLKSQDLNDKVVVTLGAGDVYKIYKELEESK